MVTGKQPYWLHCSMQWYCSFPLVQLVEALHRFFKPEPLPGFTIAIVAGIGIVINTVTALMFLRDKDKDINVKSAYLHLLSDAMVSVALVAGGIVIYYTGWYWVDAVLGIIVAVVILISTLGITEK